MGLNVGANFPGYLNELGALRSTKGLALSTAIPAVTVGGGAGALAYYSKPEYERNSDHALKSVAIGAAAGAGAALIGLVTHRFAGTGPKIGTVTGKNSYQVGTGRYEMVPVQKPVYDNAGKQVGTVTVIEPREIMETRWYKDTGLLHANKQVLNKDGFASVEDARAAVGDRHPVVGMKMDDDRVHVFDVNSSGVEVTDGFTTNDARVVFTG